MSDGYELKIEYMDQSLTAMSMFEADFVEYRSRVEEASGAEQLSERRRIY